MAQDPETEALFERLRDVVSGDAALRQLRRRYESLRHDHETLLDRLGELEERIAQQPQPAAQQSAPPSPAARLPVPVEGELADNLVSPLLRLRDEYLGAASRIQAIVEGLDTLAAAAFKGQRSAGPNAPRPAPVRMRTPEPPPRAAGDFEVDVKGSDFGSLLDFQERLSAISGVHRVSIKAIDNERASLVVELSGEAESLPDPHGV